MDSLREKLKMSIKTSWSLQAFGVRPEITRRPAPSWVFVFLKFFSLISLLEHREASVVWGLHGRLFVCGIKGIVECIQVLGHTGHGRVPFWLVVRELVNGLPHLTREGSWRLVYSDSRLSQYSIVMFYCLPEIVPGFVVELCICRLLWINPNLSWIMAISVWKVSSALVGIQSKAHFLMRALSTGVCLSRINEGSLDVLRSTDSTIL